MSEYAKTALEILKLAPRYLVSLGIVAALFLFTPEKRLNEFGISGLAHKHKPWFAITLLVTSILFAVDRTIAVGQWIRRRKEIAKVFAKRLHRLHNLTEDEKQILRFYLAKQTRANVLRVDDGVVQGLVSAGIIYRSVSMGTVSEGFAHNISDFAWDYLHENQQLLEGTKNFYGTDKRENILDRL